jgi:hypothetical protein
VASISSKDMSLQLVPELTLGPVYTSTKKSPRASWSTNGGATFAAAPAQTTSSGLGWAVVPLRKAETPLCFMRCSVLISRLRAATKVPSGGAAGAWAWPLSEQ